MKKILSGTKQYEFRKQIFRERSRDIVFIYSSSPEKKIVARFRVGEIVEGHPDYLWEEFWDVSGLNEAEFFEYFFGKENGFAIRIENLEEFAVPVDPRAMLERFVPPQSFCYIESTTIENYGLTVAER